MQTAETLSLPAGLAPQLLALADALPIGVVVLDGERVLVVNRTAAKQFAAPAAALAGTEVAGLFADAAGADRVLQADARDPHAMLRRADAALFHAEVRLHGLRLGDRALRLMLVCDLSESDRMHAQLARQHEELQAMARRLLCVQEDERRTLSRELHDDIGQQITAIKLGALALQHDDDAARRAETVAEIVSIADQTVVKLRDLSMLLRPPQLDALGLEAALRWQADVLFRSGRPRLDVELDTLPRRPPPEVELACFRIAQEALTNVLRHARACTVTLRLAVDDGALSLEIQDDGHGFDPAGAPGLGLVTMRERAHLLGGSLSISSSRDRGTCVRARLPLRPAETATG